MIPFTVLRGCGGDALAGYVHIWWETGSTLNSNLYYFLGSKELWRPTSQWHRHFFSQCRHAPRDVVVNRLHYIHRAAVQLFLFFKFQIHGRMILSRACLFEANLSSSIAIAAFGFDLFDRHSRILFRLSGLRLTSPSWMLHWCSRFPLEHFPELSGGVEAALAAFALVFREMLLPNLNFEASWVCRWKFRSKSGMEIDQMRDRCGMSESKR